MVNFLNTLMFGDFPHRALFNRRLVSSGIFEISKAVHSENTRSEDASSRRRENALLPPPRAIGWPIPGSHINVAR